MAPQQEEEQGGATPGLLHYTVLALPLMRQLVHLLQESRIGR